VIEDGVQAAATIAVRSMSTSVRVAFMELIRVREVV
jgi:hypothetical protein